MYTVSITSQGQVTIPAKVRKALGLKKGEKVNFFLEDGGVRMEPVPDLLSLAGAFSKYAKKGKSMGQIMKEERQAWPKAAVERYKRSLKNSK